MKDKKEQKEFGAMLEQREYESDKKEYDNTDHLDPVLLFTVVQGENKRGVYYVPQRGIGMQGFAFDGSIVSIALRISNMEIATIIPGEISIPKIDVDTIVQAVNTWMKSWMKDEDNIVINDEDDDE
jgi:hypothetical protein